MKKEQMIQMVKDFKVGDSLNFEGSSGGHTLRCIGSIDVEDKIFVMSNEAHYTRKELLEHMTEWQSGKNRKIVLE